jgi:hypothetical protein
MRMNRFRSEKPFERLYRCGRTGVQSLRLLLVLVACCGLVALSGCVAFHIRTQTNTLSESGFLARVPQTPKQREAYAALPPYKLQRGVTGGNVFYAYKNEKAGVVYLGGEADYERYMQRVRRLVAFYETTEAKMMAHDMDGNLQRLWYGSWDAL